MQTGYKIKEKELKKIWFVLSQDNYICFENFKIIKSICEKNNIDEDSITVYSQKKPDFDEILDLTNTVGFFGDRLIVLKDFDITSFTEEELSFLKNLVLNAQGVHFAYLFTYEEKKKIKAKKYTEFINTMSENGTSIVVEKITDNILKEVVERKCKENKTKIDTTSINLIVKGANKDIASVINETDKLCAAANYTQIDKKIIDALLIKSLEGSVFDIIDFVAQKRLVTAVERMNTLFDMQNDEVAILSVLSLSFINIHRVKLGIEKGLTYQKVYTDFENKGSDFAYQKAYGNARAFTLEGVEEILDLLLKADILFKSTSVNKKEYLLVLLAQIIAKGNKKTWKR